MEEISDKEKLRLLLDVSVADQSFYWRRFTAFAGLHAGLIVLVTAAMSGKPWLVPLVLSAVSALLAVLWHSIQCRSLCYVERWKPQFHDLIERVEINPITNLNKHGSATRLATWAPPIVLLIWFIVAGAVVYKAFGI